MYVHFQSTESVKIPVQEAKIPIQHYLRQPHRVVSAIADPKLMKQMSADVYELKMNAISFMGIYNFQPIVLLNVATDSQGTVHLKSEGCQIKGISYINRRFSLDLKGILAPQQQDGKTTLVGEANLKVGIDVPTALMFTPKSIIEATGNSLLKSILVRIKKRLISQLLEDYTQWAKTEVLPADQGKTINDLGLI